MHVPLRGQTVTKGLSAAVVLASYKFDVFSNNNKNITKKEPGLCVPVAANEMKLWMSWSTSQISNTFRTRSQLCNQDNQDNQDKTTKTIKANKTTKT